MGKSYFVSGHYRTGWEIADLLKATYVSLWVHATTVGAMELINASGKKFIANGVGIWEGYANGQEGTLPIPNVLPGHAELMSMKNKKLFLNAHSYGVGCWKIDGLSEYKYLYVTWGFPYCFSEYALIPWKKNPSPCWAYGLPRWYCSRFNYLVIMMSDRDIPCTKQLASDMWNEKYKNTKEKAKIRQFRRGPNLESLVYENDDLVIKANMDNCMRTCLMSITIEECPFTHCGE